METKKARIEYLLSEEGRKKSLLAGGDGKELQIIDADINSEIINLAKVDNQGNITLEVGHEVTLSKSVRAYYNAPGWHWERKVGTQQFDEPQTTEALIAWEKARLQALADAETDPANLAEIDRLEAEYATKKAQREAENAANAEARRQREEVEVVEKARLAQEKACWIAAHGSDYLKRTTALGYDCQRRYVTERAEAELPAFTLDFDELASWQSRSCPSEEALEHVEILGHDAQVVWLTRPTNPQDYEDEYGESGFEPCEAVVIRDYLGKYDLVRIVI